jgi:hypothetical protein
VGWWLDHYSVERKNWEATRKIADYFDALDRHGVDDTLFYYPTEDSTSQAQAGK